MSLLKMLGFGRRSQTPASNSIAARSRALRPAEALEPRRLMAGDIHLGMVYYEPNNGADTVGNTLQVSWNGGADGTQLKQLVIDTDKLGDGLTIGDTFFHTASGGPGVFSAFPFTLVDSAGIDSYNVTVANGGTKLILDFTGFDAGEKFIFKIDVDEMGFLGANAVAEGNEFEGSKLTATFTAEHFYDANGSDIFYDAFDSKFAGLGLNLPGDSYVPPGTTSSPVYTAGAAVVLEQVPLPIKLAGTVFEDINSDNDQDPGDPGIAGVTLALWRFDNGGYINTGLTTTTDAQGNYAFENVLPGQYQIRESQPNGYFSVGAKAGTVNGSPNGTVDGTDAITSITVLGGDEGVDYDFAEARPAELSGRVYHDANNNGVYDAGEQGIGGVELLVQAVPASGPLPAAITVFTAADGTWSVTGLKPGEYRVTELQPDGWIDGLDAPGTAGGVATNPGDLIAGILLVSGQSGLNYNFGELLPGSISGRVLADRDGDCTPDPGEPLLEGVTIKLFDAQGNLLATTLTDENGEYIFENLAPGVYTVEEIQPAGYFDVASHVGNAGGTKTTNKVTGITIGSGTQAVGYNFCENEPVGISGYVYVDINNNGVFDSGETPLAGVQVRLLDAAGNPTGQTTTTAANGSYSFLGLPPGTYGVSQVQPNGYFDGLDTAGSAGGTANNPGDSITGALLTPSVIATGYNFGELPPASISGRVHADRNSDCIPDPDEPLLEGVTIWLLNSQGQRIQSTTTNVNGVYEFTGLAPGVYGIEEIQPAGYFDQAGHIGSAGGVKETKNLITGILLDPGEVAVDYNFCEAMPAAISGQVHADRDGDCEVDPGETLVAGATVYLLDASGVRIKIDETDSEGRYAFEMLPPGAYSVELVLPNGYFQAASHPGSAGGSKAGPLKIVDVELTSGVSGVNYDFCVHEPVSISGRVFADLNQNCAYDTSEPGIAGVTLYLLDANGNSTGISTVTAADGTYSFVGLAPGTYGVSEVQPAGYFNGCAQPGSHGGEDDDDLDLITGIKLTPAQNATNYNFGELLPGKISGYVFQDGGPIIAPQGADVDVYAFKNGQRTADDTPLAGVELRLGTLSGDPVLGPDGQPLRVFTDANGYYEFTGLEPGQYYTVFQVQPDGYYNAPITPGAPGALAYQAGRTTQPQTLTTLQTGEAITRIQVMAGGNSTENNFSEALVEPPVIPTPPQVPPQVVFGFVPLSPPPAPAAAAGYFLGAPQQTTLLPTAPPITNNINYFGGVGYIDSYTWHLSVVNGGTPRGTPAGAGSLVRRVSTLTGDVAFKHTPMNEGTFHLYNPETGESQAVVFGRLQGRPITGDFNGDGISDVGMFVDGEWFLDHNGNGQWDEGDMWAELGRQDDLPVTGDWDGDGKADIGIFGPSWTDDERAIDAERGIPDAHNKNRHVAKNIPPQPHEAASGVRNLRKTAKGQVRSDLIDHVFRHGVAGDIPLSGDWNGDGIETIGLFSGGEWYLDLDGDGKFSRGDKKFTYGQSDDLPVVGDFDGDGVAEVGVYRDGVWYVDTDKNFKLDPHDRLFVHGRQGDIPVTGDWNGDGRDDPGVYSAGEVATQGDTPDITPST